MLTNHIIPCARRHSWFFSDVFSLTTSLRPSEKTQGFSDVGTGHPGTDSSSFKSSVFVAWREGFFKRMRAHVAAASAAIGGPVMCVCVCVCVCACVCVCV